MLHSTVKLERSLMDDNSKKELLSIARKSIDAVINKKNINITCENHELQGKQGVFVTLKNRGKLRGCLGHFTSDMPLHKLVAKIAASSATEDSRFAFDRIVPDEVDDLDIEISVLSPLKKINNPLDIELGVNGIYIKKGFSLGCFLPQVAIETGWSKGEFLSNCCSAKAGLASDAWKDNDVEIFIFTAEIFNEKDFSFIN